MKYLPTAHGFDEFYGNLYHLNAEEERKKHLDYPSLRLISQIFVKSMDHVVSSIALLAGDASQKIEDTGPLTRKRMETIDDETIAAAKEFIRNAV